MNRTKIENYKDKEWLYETYINENQTIYDIARLCNCHPRTIHNWLIKFDISRRSSFGRGSTHSEESKRRISESMKKWHDANKHPFLDKNHSAETRDKMSLSRIGSKNANWKGGITLSFRQFRKSRQYQQWRQKILRRDNHICQICGKHGTIAHHKKPAKKYPLFRLDLNNGLTLCKACHNKLHKKGGKDN